MRPTRDRIALKIILSYLVLALLGAALAYLFYLEVNTFLGTTTTADSESRIVRTSSLVTGIYQAENLSKKALQEPSEEHFKRYDQKLDSLLYLVDAMKASSKDPEQQQMLDSISLLLNRKSENTYRLRELRSRESAKSSYDLALTYFDRLEADLGRITPQALAPNFSDLPVKSQQVIRDIASYLNENIPESRDSVDADEVDSIVQSARQTLREARQAELRTQRNLSRQERLITENDLKLSEQLRGMVASMEKEALIRNMENQREKALLWRKSRRMAGLAALGGLVLVVIFTFLISRDFWKVQSYRRQLEEEKQYSDSLLQSREQLIHTVSHDLRTPLQTIKGYGELLGQQHLSPKQQEWLEHMVSASGYVEKLVNDLLDLSSLQAGKMKCEERPFTLTELIRNTAREVQAQFPGKAHLKLDLQLVTDLERPVLSDPLRVRQILTNLLTNAYKFTEQGKISIRALVKDKEILIQVEDSGIGIPDQDQESVFAEFTQAHGTTSENSEGYGLGLAISRKLAHLLHGDLSLVSESGKGSTFTLALPLNFVDTKEGSETHRTIAAVLLVDDDAGMLGLLQTQFERLELKTYAYTNATEIPKDSTLVYDIVLTDLQMPGTDGFALLQKVRSGHYLHYRNQPVILMTGMTVLDQSRWKEAGFLGLLRKPFTMNELQEVLAAGKLSLPAIPENKPGKWSKLLAFVEDDATALEILETYLKDLKRGLARMREATKSGNEDEVRYLAHKLLPMARQLDQQALAERLEFLENANNEARSPNSTAKALRKLDTAVKELETEVFKDPGYTG